MKIIALMSVLACALSACGSGSSTITGGLPPTASGGYATASDNLNTAGLSFSQSVPLVNLDGAGATSLVSRDITYTNTSDPNVFTANMGGTDITMTRVGSTNDFM